MYRKLIFKNHRFVPFLVNLAKLSIPAVWLSGGCQCLFCVICIVLFVAFIWLVLNSLVLTSGFRYQTSPHVTCDMAKHDQPSPHDLLTWLLICPTSHVQGQEYLSTSDLCVIGAATDVFFFGGHVQWYYFWLRFTHPIFAVWWGRCYMCSVF